MEEIVSFSFAYVAVFLPSPSPTQYMFHTSMAQYSLFVLKVPLNANKPNPTKWWKEFDDTCIRLDTIPPEEDGVTVGQIC